MSSSIRGQPASDVATLVTAAQRGTFESLVAGTVHTNQIYVSGTPLEELIALYVEENRSQSDRQTVIQNRDTYSSSSSPSPSPPQSPLFNQSYDHSVITDREQKTTPTDITCDIQHTISPVASVARQLHDPVNPGVGKVLTSDEFGRGTWKTLPWIPELQTHKYITTSGNACVPRSICVFSDHTATRIAESPVKISPLGLLQCPGIFTNRFQLTSPDQTINNDSKDDNNTNHDTHVRLLVCENQYGDGEWKSLSQLDIVKPPSVPAMSGTVPMFSQNGKSLQSTDLSFDDHTLRCTKLQISQGAQNGYILCSDECGMTKWVDPASVVGEKCECQGQCQLPHESYDDTYVRENIHTLQTNQQNQQDQHDVVVQTLASLKQQLNNNISHVDHMLTYNPETESYFIGNHKTDSKSKLNDDTTDVESGQGNLSVGFSALTNNTSGHYNTALGWKALEKNISSANVAVGSGSLMACKIGTSNTAVGTNSGGNIVSGDNNISIGDDCGPVRDISDSISIGKGACARFTGDLAVGSESAPLNLEKYATSGTIPMLNPEMYLSVCINGQGYKLALYKE